MSVLGLILSSFPNLRSAKARFPLHRKSGRLLSPARYSILLPKNATCWLEAGDLRTTLSSPRMLPAGWKLGSSVSCLGAAWPCWRPGRRIAACCTLYTVHCTLYTVHFTLYTVNGTERRKTACCTLCTTQGREQLPIEARNLPGQRPGRNLVVALRSYSCP